MKKANKTVNLEELNTEFIDVLELMEKQLGRELVATSGYRSPEHPIEARKKSPGEHTSGLAVDVVCLTPPEFYEVVEVAIQVGIKRIGISRKKKFIHLGMDNSRSGKTIWVY